MSDAAVRSLLREADAAFAAGDAERYADTFAADGRLFLLHRPEPIVGRSGIADFWRPFFAAHDTSDWHPRIELLETRDDRAYAFVTYTERLRSRADGTVTLVRGRLAYWMRHDEPAGWRVAMVMNSHSHPMEPLT